MPILKGMVILKRIRFRTFKNQLPKKPLKNQSQAGVPKDPSPLKLEELSQKQVIKILLKILIAMSTFEKLIKPIREIVDQGR